MNYISAFKTSVQQNADKPALVDFDGTRQTTYRELDRLSSRVAGKLHVLGCSKGDFIPVLMDRRMEYIAAYLGILKAGCVAVPLVPEIPKERISYITNHCDAKLTIDISFFDDVETYEPFEDLAGDDEPALLIYTSGSTGTPKGILHTVNSVVHSLKRMKPLFFGLDPVVLAATIPLSFIVHVQEYLLTFFFGGTIHILSDEQRKSHRQLISYYEKHSVTCGFIPAQMLTCIPALPKSFRRVYTGGEQLTTIPDSLNADIYYLYGQGETCSGVTLNIISADHRTCTLGKALDGIEISIADEKGDAVERGLEGEICVKGGFGVEYFKFPEATKETFIKTDDGKTLVHTGDIGFIDKNGDLNYVTRKDWMVKINGQRVETLEVERVLQSVEHIREAAVKAFSDADSQNYLVGYYVSDVELSTDDIRISLAEKLPSYMIPRYLVRLDAIPKNQNGKTDRTALVLPEFTEGGKKIPSSLNELQTGISDIVAKIVGHRGFGITTKFFDAGIDSLGMIKLIAELEQNYQVTLQTDMVNQYNTIEKLSEYLTTAKQEEIFPIQEDYPLSKNQQTMYSWCKYYPRYYPSIIAVQLKLRDTVDTDRFVKAVETVINAHPYLKTTFRINDEGEVRAVRNDSLKPSVLRIKCEYLPKREELIRPHELVNSLLYRAEIYETPSGTYFYLDMHHTISDGVSLVYLFRDICSAYRGKELEKESCTGFEAGLIDEIKIKSEAFRAAKKYYANLLKGCIPTIIPCSTDAVNPGMIRRKISSTLSLSEINAYCAEHRCSANALYHAAFAYLLNTYVGTNDVLFHTIHSGRTDSRYANSLSLYAAPAPVRCSFTRDKKIENVISDMEYHLHESISNCVNSHADIEANEGSTTKIWFINESNNMEIVNKLTESQMLLPDIMQIFDVRDMVMDVLVPPKYEQAGNDYNGCVQIHWYIAASLSGDLAFAVMGDGGRYSESFLDEMLLRYDKIIREFITKEYLSEIVL